MMKHSTSTSEVYVFVLFCFFSTGVMRKEDVSEKRIEIQNRAVLMAAYALCAARPHLPFMSKRVYVENSDDRMKWDHLSEIE